MKVNLVPKCGLVAKNSYRRPELSWAAHNHCDSTSKGSDALWLSGHPIGTDRDKNLLNGGAELTCAHHPNAGDGDQSIFGPCWADIPAEQ